MTEVALEPGDLLLLHTDGITEARDSHDNFFGLPRLIDFAERETAAGYPPPEIARRLARAVLDHQNGILQDEPPSCSSNGARESANGPAHEWAMSVGRPCPKWIAP